MQKFFENQSAQVYYDATLDTLFLEYTNKIGQWLQWSFVSGRRIIVFQIKTEIIMKLEIPR